MIALLSSYQFHHARHLYRRSAFQNSPEMELLWLVTRHILNNNIVDAFQLLKSLRTRTQNVEIKEMMDELLSSLQVRQKNILASAFAKVNAGFAAKQLGLESADDAVTLLANEGWKMNDRNFLVPPPKKALNTSAKKSMFDGTDALQQMMEVATFLDYKRLNE